MFLVIVIIIFAERATGDWRWMPLRMENQFSWSYALAVVAAFFSTANVLTLSCYFSELKIQMEMLRGKDYEMYLRDNRY